MAEDVCENLGELNTTRIFNFKHNPTPLSEAKHNEKHLQVVLPNIRPNYYGELFGNLDRLVLINRVVPMLRGLLRHGLDSITQINDYFLH